MKFNIVLIIAPILLFAQCHSAKKEYVYNEGTVFGGYYHITYESSEGKDYKPEIEKMLQDFNSSLSTYDSNSIISRINNNDSTVKTDEFFEKMYNIAKEVSEKTNGAFDITVAPLVNAWGFGSGNHDRTIKPNIDTILPFVGYEKIRLENHQLVKQDKRIRIDANALAPGQAADVVAQFLDEKGSENYLIEIGGEINCKGLNAKGEKWHVGIDKPVEDPSDENKELQAIIAVSNIGLATSGNYREFYYKDGKKYAHTIDPKTGNPVEHNLLSATVIAPTCAQADAYATACMVIGAENAVKLCESIQGLECYLIYNDKDGKNKVVQSKGFNQFLVK